MKHCPDCLVEWHQQDDGTECWACGRPGVDGYLKRGVPWVNTAIWTVENSR